MSPHTSEDQATRSVREQLRTLAADLGTIRSRLFEVHGSLPVPPEEAVMLLGEMDMDFSTEVRTVIECVVHDWVDAAIRDLQAAADYVTGEEKGE